MRELRTSGSVGGRGGQPPRPTRLPCPRVAICPGSQKGRHRRFDPFSMHRSSAGRTAADPATGRHVDLPCRRGDLCFTYALTIKEVLYLAPPPNSVTAKNKIG